MRMTRSNASALRALPQVQRLMETPCARALVGEFSREAVLRAVRGGLGDVRKRLLTGNRAGALAFGEAAFFDDVRARLGRERQRSLRRTIDATGIVAHTNLGRPPSAAEALEAVAEVAAGYSNLELDLVPGSAGRATGPWTGCCVV